MATTTTTTTSSSSISGSSTYEQYQSLVKKVLIKSRKNLDTTALVRLAYGNDTARFGGDEMLVDILEGVLDKLVDDSQDGTVLPLFWNECETFSLKSAQRLDAVDHAVRLVTDWETQRSETERRDKSSAREALDHTLLGGSSSLTVDEIVLHKEYQEKLKVQTRLQAELAKVQGEIANLEAGQDKKRSEVVANLHQVQKVEQELEAAADVCSMGFVQPISK